LPADGTEMLEAIRSHVLALPDLAKFAVLVAAVVGVPRLAARLRTPPMVGLLLFGVLLGPHVHGLVDTELPHFSCHTGEGRCPYEKWIPAFAGKTNSVRLPLGNPAS
jgi:Sodium/hydrogen exchanger family